MFGMVEDGSVVVRIPQFRGSFEIDVRSHTLKRAVLSRIDPPERVELATRQIDPQRDVLDIGANIGLYTIVFSKVISSGHKVFSVEPTPRALELLHRNIKRNGCAESVIVFEGVATDAKGSCRLNVIPGMEQYSSLGELVHSSIQGKLYQSIEVRGDTIDNMVAQFGLVPGFIKVDTEGAEYLVFRGAMYTLEKHKPVIWFELSDLLLSSLGHTSRMVIGLLEEIGYEIRDALNPTAPITDPFDGEILAIPRGTKKN